MSNTTFRNAPVQPDPVETVNVPEFKKNEVGPSVEPEPIEKGNLPQTVMDVLGIEENIYDLPSDVVDNINEIASYIEDNLKSKGKVPSVLTIGKTLDKLKEDLEMDDDTDMSVVMDRIGGVVKAWKNLGFMTDPASKRSMFMRLARCKDSKEMHKLVFKNYEQSGSWQ